MKVRSKRGALDRWEIQLNRLLFTWFRSLDVLSLLCKQGQLLAQHGHSYVMHDAVWIAQTKIEEHENQWNPCPVQDAIVIGLTKSTIKDLMEGWGFFPKWSLGKRTVIGYYSQAVFNQKAYEIKHNDILFREGALSVNLEDIELIMSIFERGWKIQVRLSIIRELCLQPLARCGTLNTHATQKGIKIGGWCGIQKVELPTWNLYIASFLELSLI